MQQLKLDISYLNGRAASLPLPVSPIKWIDGDLDASMDLMGDSSFLAAANVSLGDDSFDLGRLLLKHRSPQSKPSSSLVVSRRANATTAAKAEADNEIESASDDQGAFTLSATVNGNRETLNLGPGWPTDSSPREMPRSISNSNIFDESGERSLLYANLTIGDDEELEELISASNEHAEAGPHPMRSAFSQGQDAQARVLSSGTSNSNVAQAIGGSNMSRSTGLPSARQTSAEGLASTAAGVATPLAKGCSTPRVSLSASSSRASVATTPLTHRTSNKPPVAYDRQKRRPSAAQTTPIGKSHRTNLGASREASTIVSPTKPRLSTATTASRTTPRASLASSSVRRPTALNSATPQPSRQPGRSLAAGAGPTSITRSTSSGSNVATSSSDSKVPALNGGRPALARLAGANPRYGDASARSANAAVRHVATGLPPRRTDSKAPGDGTRSRSGSVDSTATVSGAQSPVQKASAGGQRLSRLLASSNAPDLGSTRRDAYMPDSPTRGADRGFSAEEPMNLADVCTTTREEVLAVAEAPAQTTAAPDVRTRPSDVRPGGTVSRTKSALPAPYVSKRALGRTTSSLPTATGGSRIGRPTKVGTSGPAAPGAKPSGIARPTGLRKPTASAAPRPGGFVSRALAGATESGAAPSAKESATGTSVSGLRAPMTRKQ